MRYLIIAGLVIAAVVSVALLWKSEEGRDLLAVFCGVAGFILAISTGISAIIFSYAIFEYVGSEYKAAILNREYGTSYTAQEVFYGSGVIETIRELDKKRVEINGNILKGETE
jgi:hypothetical protein